MARVLVPLAPGVEEMEAVIVIDTLRRAGWEVVAAAMSDMQVLASRGVKLVCDTAWTNVDPATFDVLVIPGGAGGTRALVADEQVLEAVRSFVQAGKTAAAICAGPLVLQAAGVLEGRRATCHPAARADLTQPAEITDDRVVVDGHVVTSQGPGTAFEFALALVRELDGPEAATAIAEGLVMPPGT